MSNTKRAWFLPPDFTFPPDGELRLGTVISHPSNPTPVLAHPDTASPSIPLPKKEILTERNHTHTREDTRSFEGNIFARFISIASALARVDSRSSILQQYGNADHDVCFFATEPTDEAIAAIMELPKVSQYVNSGMFGRRAVYIISGIRVTRASFSVVVKSAANRGTGFTGSGSGPVGGGAHIGLGGGVSRNSGNAVIDSYETAPGVIFAYRVHAIRPSRGGGVKTQLFSDRGAFLTGTSERDEKMEISDVTLKDIEEEIEEEVEFDAHDLDDHECCVTFK
ncbi:hypothetical protein FQN55_006765 [Onygenales sp. PD_40]|nr:hypothetical protein FQN55_006765 [Onygenales sp. PD_40]KAK2783470.1 hypothetical protein FQN52_009590 [Onygenales sp. PD_12]